MGLNEIDSLSHTKWNCKYHARLQAKDGIPPAVQLTAAQLLYELHSSGDKMTMIAAQERLY